jgi:hypothetical protein
MATNRAEQAAPQRHRERREKTKSLNLKNPKESFPPNGQGFLFHPGFGFSVSSVSPWCKTAFLRFIHSVNKDDLNN